MADPELVRLVDQLESAAEGYLTLDQVQRAAGRDLSDVIAEGVLLVDYRTGWDSASGVAFPVTLCRLNRHHPLVQQITQW